MSGPAFEGSSLPDAPRLEFVFEIKLEFARHDTIKHMPSGAGRGFVYVDSGIVRGPRLNGRVMPLSGGDWALFRPDDVLATDARYMLEADDGTKILMYNRGYLWGGNRMRCRGCASGCSATGRRCPSRISTCDPRRLRNGSRPA